MPIIIDDFNCLDRLVQRQERRAAFRRSSDRNFMVSITLMFALVALIGFAFGYYEASREAAQTVIEASK